MSNKRETELGDPEYSHKVGAGCSIKGIPAPHPSDKVDLGLEEDWVGNRKFEKLSQFDYQVCNKDFQIDDLDIECTSNELSRLMLEPNGDKMNLTPIAAMAAKIIEEMSTMGNDIQLNAFSTTAKLVCEEIGDYIHKPCSKDKMTMLAKTLAKTLNCSADLFRSAGMTSLLAEMCKSITVIEALKSSTAKGGGDKVASNNLLLRASLEVWLMDPKQELHRSTGARTPEATIRSVEMLGPLQTLYSLLYQLLGNFGVRFVESKLPYLANNAIDEMVERAWKYFFKNLDIKSETFGGQNAEETAMFWRHCDEYETKVNQAYVIKGFTGRDPNLPNRVNVKAWIDEIKFYLCYLLCRKNPLKGIGYLFGRVNDEWQWTNYFPSYLRIGSEYQTMSILGPHLNKFREDCDHGVHPNVAVSRLMRWCEISEFHIIWNLLTCGAADSTLFGTLAAKVQMLGARALEVQAITQRLVQLFVNSLLNNLQTVSSLMQVKPTDSRDNFLKGFLAAEISSHRGTKKDTQLRNSTDIPMERNQNKVTNNMVEHVGPKLSETCSQIGAIFKPVVEGMSFYRLSETVGAHPHIFPAEIKTTVDEFEDYHDPPKETGPTQRAADDTADDQSESTVSYETPAIPQEFLKFLQGGGEKGQEMLATIMAMQRAEKPLAPEPPPRRKVWLDNNVKDEDLTSAEDMAARQPKGRAAIDATAIDCHIKKSSFIMKKCRRDAAKATPRNILLDYGPGMWDYVLQCFSWGERGEIPTQTHESDKSAFTDNMGMGLMHMAASWPSLGDPVANIISHAAQGTTFMAFMSYFQENTKKELEARKLANMKLTVPKKEGSE